MTVICKECSKEFVINLTSNEIKKFEKEYNTIIGGANAICEDCVYGNTEINTDTLLMRD